MSEATDAEPEADSEREGNAEVVAPDARRRDGWGTFWMTVLLVDIGLVALYGLANVVAGLVLLTAPDSQYAKDLSEAARTVSAGDIWLNAVLLFVFLGVIPAACIFGSRVRPWQGGIRYLRLDRPWPAAAKGVGYGLLMVVAAIVIAAIYVLVVHGPDALREDTESPVIEGIFSVLTWPMAVAIALAAGVAEEIFFRGILQKHLGMVGQAVAFAVVHAGYGTVLQLLFPLAIGLLFGYWIKRGARLWLPIAAHFTFNFVQLAGGLLAK